MKHLSLIILALFCSLATTVRAQYYSVNYDEKTVEAMAAAYASGAAAEGYYNEQVQKKSSSVMVLPRSPLPEFSLPSIWSVRHGPTLASGLPPRKTTTTIVSTTWWPTRSCQRYGLSPA